MTHSHNRNNDTDTALILKQKVDAGEIKDFNQASDYLDKSKIVKDLLTDFDFDILNLLNRLTEITEISFAHRLDRVQKWRDKLADLSFCDEGFSITGKRDDILSCYNSMITSILILMDYKDKIRINKGIEWILKYQNVERGTVNKWTGSRILKYGGCMKTTPCYIGVVKAMIALTDYKKYLEINSTYLPKCWMQFDKPNEAGLWISYEIYKLMN